MTDKLKLKLNDTVVEITQDDSGRYCLNDLFKASGATMSHTSGFTVNPWARPYLMDTWIGKKDTLINVSSDVKS